MDTLQQLFQKFKMADTPQEAVDAGSALLLYAQLFKRQAQQSHTATATPAEAAGIMASLDGLIHQVSSALKELGLNPQQIIEIADARFNAAQA